MQARLSQKGSRLSLRPAETSGPADEAKAEPAVATPSVPVFDPEALAVTTYGDGGAGFIQGKNYFTAAGKFVRELPKEQWYITTPEMERNNKIARAKWRAMRHGKQAGRPGGPAIPEKLLEVHKENSRALAAEALAE